MSIGVRHRRILAHDVHAAYVPRVDCIHNLDDGQAGLRDPASLPTGCSKTPARIVIVHALVIRKYHWYEAGIRRALHVILPAQRMQTDTRTSDLSRHHAQRNEQRALSVP